MGKIVSPFPPLLDAPDRKPHPDASWWRFRLRPNDDNHLMFVQTDARGEDMQSATWVSWEFFDGENTIIDAGMDSIKIDKAVLTYLHPGGYLDILSVAPPTPSPYWIRTTMPGDYRRPDGHGDPRVIRQTNA